MLDEQDDYTVDLDPEILADIQKLNRWVIAEDRY